MSTEPGGIMVELSAPGATTLRVVVSQPLVVGREGSGLRIPEGLGQVAIRPVRWTDFGG